MKNPGKMYIEIVKITEDKASLQEAINNTVDRIRGNIVDIRIIEKETIRMSRLTDYHSGTAYILYTPNKELKEDLNE